MRDYIITIDENGSPVLAHYGILGMKWGVRRFQNKDGTRTSAGKAREREDVSDWNATEEKIRKAVFNSPSVQKELASNRPYPKKIDRVTKAVYKEVHNFKDNRLDDRELEELFSMEIAENMVSSKDLSDEVINYKGPGSLEKINSEITSATKYRKELRSLIDEAHSLNTELENEYNKWENNKALVQKTTNAYIKEYHKEDQSDYYKNLAGIDAAANVWGYYMENTPKLKAKNERIYDIQTDYEKASEKYFRSMLREYGDRRVPNNYGSKTDVARFLSVHSRDKFFDFMIDYDYYFTDK